MLPRRLLFDYSTVVYIVPVLAEGCRPVVNVNGEGLRAKPQKLMRCPKN